MKKIISGVILAVFLWQSSVFATVTDNCRQYAYGYMTDGKVYMMLAGKKYGPFNDVEQLKFTLERMWPQFKENLRQYMLYNPNGGPDKYIVYQSELGDCNPYALDMDTVAAWNAKITTLFLQLNDRFAGNPSAYRTALSGALSRVNTLISQGKASAKTLEILKLIRDRFAAKLRTI